MSEQGKLEAEAIAAALEFKEAIVALMNKHGVHAALLCWVTPSIDEHVGVESCLHFGCSECGGKAAGLAVRHLDVAWRGTFLEQLHRESNFKVIHAQNGSSQVN